MWNISNKSSFTLDLLINIITYLKQNCFYHLSNDVMKQLNKLLYFMLYRFFILPFLSIKVRKIKTKWEKIKQRTSSPLFWIRICSWPCLKYLQFFVHVIRSSLFSLVKLFYVKIPILSCAKLFPAIFIVRKMHNSTWIFCENDENRGCCLS